MTRWARALAFMAPGPRRAVGAGARGADPGGAINGTHGRTDRPGRPWYSVLTGLRPVEQRQVVLRGQE